MPTHSASVPRPRFLWEQHCCLPLTTTTRTADLLRYDTGAGAFTSLSVGDLVAEMNAVGMVVDGSHCSRRTGLDLCEVSASPVIYSHSCMRSMWEHERNITDEQALACAETGDVVGIAGEGIFLGENEATLEAMVRHIDHAVELLGPEHVGIGSDFSFDHLDAQAEFASHPDLFPETYTRYGGIDWVPPEHTRTLGTELQRRGYPEEAITMILGGNFRRVAEQVWT